jgi:hypothetical protein
MGKKMFSFYNCRLFLQPRALSTATKVTYTFSSRKYKILIHLSSVLASIYETHAKKERQFFGVNCAQMKENVKHPSHEFCGGQAHLGST